MPDTSDSQILEARFPGFAWMPRWMRRHWTPQNAVASVFAIFSVGAWVGTYLTAPDMREIKAAMSADCKRGCVLKREDIAVLESHVSDLWDKKNRIEEEAEKPALPAAPSKKASGTPQREPPKPEKRGKVHAR